MMKFTTILKDQSFWSVKRQFTKKEGELLRYLTPPGCEVIHYRGLRRGAIIKLLMFNRPITFKVITYTTDLHKLYFNDILKEGNFFGIKFWSHRHRIDKHGHHKDDTIIVDEIEFTTKNKALDFFYRQIIRLYFLMRKVKYRLFFIFN